MTDQENKCVIIADAALPLGILANTTAILGISIGKLIPDIVGPDVSDASGNVHKGITTQPVPILKGDQSILKALQEKLSSPDFSDILSVDFSNTAQSCNSYDNYIAKAAATPETDYNYLGLALYGSKKKINKLTGSMPLLR